MGKVADEVNELPTALHASVLAAIGKRRHSREPHAILDDPEQLAVGKILCFRQAQIRWLGVEATANHGLPAAVVGVADGADPPESRAEDSGPAVHSKGSPGDARCERP